MNRIRKGCRVIEGPVWHDERSLNFRDIEFGGVFALDTTAQVSQVFKHRECAPAFVTGTASIKPFIRSLILKTWDQKIARLLHSASTPM